MDLRFYNTLSHQIETFAAVDPPNVYMYTCGPTVYDYAHIGNFRTFVFDDVLRRFLEFSGYRVHQVMNLTDLGHMTEDDLADGGGEDKMVVASRRLQEAKKAGTLPPGTVDNPDDPHEIAQYYAKAFVEDARQLRLKIADEPHCMPWATEHVPQMQTMISKLIDRGHAYVGGDGAVYYSVESFPNYGRLSGNVIKNLREGGGGRVQGVHQAAKRHPADFFLWKPDPNHVMKWDSPWGTGYPNWHIECSVMAAEFLGRQIIDIHTGGEDNIFPHHECEIAQTCGATGNDVFAHLWMHARFLLVDGEKMSKRNGTFYTVRDVLGGKVTGRPTDSAALRYELLKSHYRANLSFTRQGLTDSAKAVRRLDDLWSRLLQDGGGARRPVDLSHPIVSQFAAALADDLNVSGALGVVFEWAAQPHPNAAEDLSVLEKIDSVLGLGLGQAIERSPAESAEEGCRKIDQARARKDYDTADQIRQSLIDAGYDVQTTKAGTTARKHLA